MRVHARHHLAEANIDPKLVESLQGLLTQTLSECSEDLVTAVDENDLGLGGINPPEVLAERSRRQLSNLA